MYFCCALRLRHGPPFDAGRETGAAAAAQAGLQDFLDGRRRAERERAFEALAAAMGAIVLERARIDDAAARERQPRLPLEPRDFLGRPQAAAHARRRRRWRRSSALGIARRDRPIGDAARRRFPPRPSARATVQPARAVADDFDRDVLPRRCGADGGRDFVRADRQRAGVASV